MYRRSVRQGLATGAFLTGMLLVVACGGGGPDVERADAGAPAALAEPAIFSQPVTIDINNAAVVAGVAHALLFGLPRLERPTLLGVQVRVGSGSSAAAAEALVLAQAGRWLGPGQFVGAVSGREPCAKGGTTHASSDARRLNLRFEQCDQGGGEILHGYLFLRNVAIEPIGGGQRTALTAEFRRLRISSENALPRVLDGVLDLVWQEDGNALRKSTSTRGHLYVEEQGAVAGFKNAQFQREEAWTAGIADWTQQVDTLRAAASALGGYVDVHAEVAPRGTEAPCPQSGVLRIRGAGGSGQSIHYGTDAVYGTVEAYLNDVPMPLVFASCEAFLAAID